MKALLTIIVLFISMHLFAQPASDITVQKLSDNIFKWEVAGKIDSLANLFDDRLIIVNSGGVVLSKNDYLSNLKKGQPVHNSISVQESSVKIAGKTAIVSGVGSFTVTNAGVMATHEISYTELFIQQNKTWKLLVLQAHLL